MGILIGFLVATIFEIFILAFLRAIGFYTIVNEGTAKVFSLFGKVIGEINEPGIHFLWLKFHFKAPLIHFFGQVFIVDMRLDQRYLRSQTVNSEEGAPMGIGIWYEMFISDPSNYLFINANPDGSLAANVSNATVRCLSNMPLAKLLMDRHGLSQTVRKEVTDNSKEWGYEVGSVYIRKVHFRDNQMIKQIESKVVNRLRQVTASITQDGENQVNVITSSAQSNAAFEFAKASAVRPRLVGETLSEIAKNPDVAKALLTVLEIQKLQESKAEIVLIPEEGVIRNSVIVGNAT
jgi:regulator of protease activity HflC (stomatin/prohibitin superfamily)